MKTINKALFALEGIACLLIVIHHCNFPSGLGFALDTIARIGVPIFFMVSGYFNYKADNVKIKNMSDGTESITPISEFLQDLPYE